MLGIEIIGKADFIADGLVVAGNQADVVVFINVAPWLVLIAQAERIELKVNPARIRDGAKDVQADAGILAGKDDMHLGQPDEGIQVARADAECARSGCRIKILAGRRQLQGLGEEMRDRLDQLLGQDGRHKGPV